MRSQTAEPDSCPARCHRRILCRLLELKRRKGEWTWGVRRLPWPTCSGGIAKVDFAWAGIQVRGDEMQFGVPQSPSQIGKFTIAQFCFFSMSFPIKSRKKTPLCQLNSWSNRLASRMIPKLSSLKSFKWSLAEISRTSSTSCSSARRVALMASAEAPLTRWIFERMSSSSRLL